MSSKKYVHRMLVCSVLASLASVPVLAAEADDAFDLGEYVVTATRTKAATVDVAADTQVISQATIEKGNYSSVSEALKNNDVAVIQKGPASYPIINGDNRVIVLVNGRKMNFNHLLVSGASNAMNIDNIPMDNVERIEVVKGPNSSLYGEKAVAGVINIITKAPEPGLTVRTNAEFGTWNYRKGGISIDGGDEDTRFSLGYSKEIRDNYDYKAPNGSKHEFTDSSINRETLTARVDRKVNNDDRLTFDFSRTHKNDGYGLYVKDINVGEARYAGGTQVGTDLSYGVQYTFGAES